MNDDIPVTSSHDALANSNLNLPLNRIRTRRRPSQTATRTKTVTPTTPVTEETPLAYLAVKGDLHQRLLDDLDRRDLLGAEEERLTEVVQDFVDQTLAGQDLPLNTQERRR